MKGDMLSRVKGTVKGFFRTCTRKKKRVYRYRSAVTGRFVSRKKAERYPFTTIKERIR